MNESKEVCTAHNVIIDNVNYIRQKQDETAGVVGDMRVDQANLKSAVDQVQETQKQIVLMLKKRRWTTAKVSVLVASVFGSGSAFPTILSIIFKAVK